MGSPFASHTQSDPIPVPGDPPHWIQVRQLTGHEHDTAAVGGRDLFLGDTGRAFPALLRRALEKGATDPDVVKALGDPLLGYDRYALVKAGLVAWSYDEPITPDCIDKELVENFVEFSAREVLRRTKPHLFYTTEVDASADRKSPADDPASIARRERAAAV